MNIRKWAGISLLACVLIAAGWTARGRWGRSDKAAPSDIPVLPRMAPPLVSVQTVRLTPLPVVAEYVARIEPVQQAHVTAEVSGIIAAVHFKEGSVVDQGSLLFTIEQDQYRATVAAREAEFERANTEYERARLFAGRLREADVRSVSRTAQETAQSDLQRAEAGMKLAQANLDLAQIALNRTEVRAPISGRIGMARLTRGNMAGPASGALASIAQTDPIRVRFSIADRDFFSQHRDNALPPARVRLPDGAVLPVTGRLDFVDNMMNPASGSITIRYLFENPGEQLVPGGHATVLLEQPEYADGIAVSQQAVLFDAQGAYAFTVAPNNIVVPARLETGARIGPDIVVLSGLEPGNRVIVEGVQKVYAGFPVRTIPFEDGQ